jgi:hypothetical protein
MFRLLMMPGQGPDNQTARSRYIVFRWTVADGAARMVRWMLLLRLGNPRLVDGFDGELPRLGEAPVLDLAYELEDRGELERLLTVEAKPRARGFWPRLQPLLQPAGS